MGFLSLVKFQQHPRKSAPGVCTSEQPGADRCEPPRTAHGKRAAGRHVRADTVHEACGQMGRGRVQLSAFSLRGALGIRGAARCNSISRGLQCQLKSSISLILKVIRQNIKIWQSQVIITWMPIKAQVCIYIYSPIIFDIFLQF